MIPSARTHQRRSPGFALLELVVVLLLIALMAGIVGPRIGEQHKRERDSQRVQDIGVLLKAIETYAADSGDYPANDETGWSCSTEEDFLAVLVRAGYLGAVPHDPLNDETHQYRYFRYRQGSYGCHSQGPFFVLGARTFETEEARARVSRNLACSERDWDAEFDYVIGGGLE